MDLDLNNVSSPVFFSSEEKSVLFDMVSEAFEVSYRIRPVVQIDRYKQQVDPFIQEATKKVWGNIIYLPCHFLWEPPQYLLSIFSVDIFQQVAITFSSNHLLERGVTDIEDLIGSVVFYDFGPQFFGEEYIIDSIVRTSSDVINTKSDIPLVMATASLFRPRASEYASELPVAAVMDGWKQFAEPVFYDENGVETVQSINKEFYSFVFPEIPILAIDRSSSPSGFFLETTERCWQQLVKLPGFVRWSPVVHSLVQQGFDASQEVVVRFSASELDESSLELSSYQDLVGAVLCLRLDPLNENILFEVISVKEEPYDLYSTFNNIELTLDLFKSDEYLPVDFSDFGVSPTFFSKDEVDFQQGVMIEYLYTGYPTVPLVLIDRDKTEINNFIRESNSKVWKNPVHIPAQLQWEPAQYILEEWGISVDTELLVTTSSLVLSQLGLETYRDLEGAIIVVDTDQDGIRKEFEVLGVHFSSESSVSFTGDVLNIALTAKVRPPGADVYDSGLPSGLADDKGLYFFK